MAKTDTQTVARLLRKYAHRASLRGGTPYRAKAYATAADSLAALPQPLDRIIAAGTLTEIPGIGDAIADIITKLHQTGSHPSLEKLRKEVPEGALELLAVPGLRPDKILKLHQELGVSSLADLEAAAKEDRIRKVKGLGAPLQTKILQSLSMARGGETHRHLHKAAALLEHAFAALTRHHPEYFRLEIAGNFRRGCELVTDLALIAETKTPPEGEDLSGELKLTVTDRRHFGASFLHATGSAEHLELLSKLARKKGSDLKPDGLYRGKNSSPPGRRTIFTKRWTCSLSLSSAKERKQRSTACRSLSATKTCMAFSTVTQPPRSAQRRWRRWRKRRASAVSSISVSPIIRSPLTMREVCLLKRLPNSINRPTGLISGTAHPFGFKRD
jgi:DNA polymerase/3'-5' exonuclease PolX